MFLLTFGWKSWVFSLFNFWPFFLNNAVKSGPTSTEKSPMPTKISCRQFNPGENLPRAITLNNSTRKIETEKRARHIKRILYRNFCKFLQCIILPDKFTSGLPSHGKSHRGKTPAENSSPPPDPKMYTYFPTTNTMRKQWTNFIT